MTHEYKVEDMTCGHCVSRVTKSLRTFDPDVKVSIDLASHRVVIDGAADRDDYAWVIRDTGYTPA
jgi:copper chaperone